MGLKTVGQLIDALNQYPHNMRVVVSGYESGFQNIVETNRLLVCLNHPDGGGDYFGEHQKDIPKREGERTEVLWLVGTHDAERIG